MPVLLFTVPVFSTLLGGLMAVRFRRYIHLLLALGAGLLLGAAFLDLLPEALTIGAKCGFTGSDVLGLTLLCFLLFHATGNGVQYLTRKWQGTATHKHITRRIGATMLIFHSFRDGMAIGAAYSASHAAGYAVAVGIAAHDFGDGMNTIILTTGGDKPQRTEYGFLLADAIAPLAGGLLTTWWVFSSRGSVVLIALAAGFFLQMATEDFLPEIRHCAVPRMNLVAAVLLGVAAIYVANLLLAISG